MHQYGQMVADSPYITRTRVGSEWFFACVCNVSDKQEGRIENLHIAGIGAYVVDNGGWLIAGRKEKMIYEFPFALIFYGTKTVFVQRQGEIFHYSVQNGKLRGIRQVVEIPHTHYRTCAGSGKRVAEAGHFSHNCKAPAFRCLRPTELGRMMIHHNVEGSSPMVPESCKQHISGREHLPGTVPHSPAFRM